MTVYKGWYRKSLSREHAVWHRVVGLRAEASKPQVAQTACGREIQISECDFSIKPTNVCRTCEMKGCMHTVSRQYAPIGRSSSRTISAAKAELKRLLKTRTYYVELHGQYLLGIEAAWKSDVSVDIECFTTVQNARKRKKTTTFERAMADIGRFKTAIDCLIDDVDKLAEAAKRKNGQSGKLTIEESQRFFENLLADVEK